MLVSATKSSSSRSGAHVVAVGRDCRAPARFAFERDWDCIIFSTAFRRMHDKTQLFPLPDDDVVHSRLTHSLEVSSVGRSLGKHAGQAIC